MTMDDKFTELLRGIAKDILDKYCCGSVDEALASKSTIYVSSALDAMVEALSLKGALPAFLERALIQAQREILIEASNELVKKATSLRAK